LDESSEIGKFSDWPKLRKALSEPVREIIFAEIDNPAKAQRIIAEIAKIAPSKHHVIIEFSALFDETDDLLARCREKAKGIPPDRGTLFLIDKTGGFDDATDTVALNFWKRLNLLREQWFAMDAQCVFFLQPRSYRFVSSVADHFKRWVPLKLHFTENPLGDFVSSREMRDAKRQILAMPNAKQALDVLEKQFGDALGRGESQATFAARYYIPMFITAVDASEFSRAGELLKQIRDFSIPAVLFPDWSRTLTAYLATRRKIKEATKVAEHYLKWARANGRRYDEAAASYLFGMLWVERENPKEAEIWLKKSLNIFQEIKSEEQIPRIYGELGNVARLRGNFQDAEALYLEALKLAEQQGDQHAMSLTFNQLGITMGDKGDNKAAKEWFEKALESGGKMKNRDLIKTSFGNLAVASKRLGEVTEFEKWVQKYLEAAPA
jgi:tetratricopeptide (TPR) repeat protein